MPAGHTHPGLKADARRRLDLLLSEIETEARRGADSLTGELGARLLQRIGEIEREIKAEYSAFGATEPRGGDLAREIRRLGRHFAARECNLDDDVARAQDQLRASSARLPQANPPPGTIFARLRRTLRQLDRETRELQLLTLFSGSGTAEDPYEILSELPVHARGPATLVLTVPPADLGISHHGRRLIFQRKAESA